MSLRKGRAYAPSGPWNLDERHLQFVEVSHIEKGLA
jgi:hypothetical protein